MPDHTAGALGDTTGLPSVSIVPAPTLGAPRTSGSRQVGEVTRGEPDSASPHRLRETLMAILVSALILLVGVGGLYALSLLDQRDATIVALEHNVANLQATNLAFAKEIKGLGVERSQLLEARQVLTRERDVLVGEKAALVGERESIVASREQLVTERDRLNTRLGDLDKQLTDTKNRAAEADRQTSQARDGITRQQDLTKAAETKNTQLYEVIKVDNDINREFAIFMSQYDVLVAAFQRLDYVAAQEAYNRGMTSANKIDTLLDKRDRLLAQIK